METELARQLRRLQHGDHCCLVYETPAEQRAATVPFFIEGLVRGERCFWVVDDQSADDAKSVLHDAGIDVGAEIARGALTVMTKRETYLKDGAFDPRAMMMMLADTLRETAASGFSGLRTSGEMTWALGGDAGADRIIEYESLLNDVFPGKAWVGICQYDRSRFAPSTIIDVLRTHSYAVVGELVCPNLYFEPNAMFFGNSTDAERLDWRLMQLRRAREAARTLEQTIVARDSFFAVASHELKTPLAALQLQLDLVAGALSKGDRPSEARRIEGAIEQTRRLNDLAECLLDVTQLHTRGLSLSREPCDLGDIVRDVVRRLAVIAKKACCSVELSLSEVRGSWDRVRLEQVVTNLLTNAFKYGAGKPVHVMLSALDETGELRVHDEGIGIANADQARIFGFFERAVSERHYTGFGVGLWMVQQIVEAHDGKIDVESAPGRGATFTVRLPCNAS